MESVFQSIIKKVDCKLTTANREFIVYLIDRFSENIDTEDTVVSFFNEWYTFYSNSTNIHLQSMINRLEPCVKYEIHSSIVSLFTDKCNDLIQFGKKNDFNTEEINLLLNSLIDADFSFDKQIRLEWGFGFHRKYNSFLSQHFDIFSHNGMVVYSLHNLAVTKTAIDICMKKNKKVRIMKNLYCMRVGNISLFSFLHMNGYKIKRRKCSTDLLKKN